MSQPSKKRKMDHEAEKLPLRWALILAIASATGVAAGLLGGAVVGMTAGIATLVALHKIIA
jgi:hypothetical protein